jgi:hypothetical protein
MTIGISILVDDKGNVIVERTVVIEDGATTAVKTENHYDIGWKL